jgi:hypothetical protein
MRFIAPTILGAVLLTACAEPQTATPPGDTAQRRYEATTFVLEDDEGAKLCLGGVLESLPPQCDGVPVRGWSWDGVKGEDSQAGVSWGEFHVVGSYDGSTFDLISAGPPRPSVEEEHQFKPPCPEPEGGWTSVDPSKTGEDDRTTLMRTVENIPAYAGLWIGYLHEPIDYEAPGEYVVTVAFTGDPADHEAAIREVWGGPLCLTSAEHTFAELRRTQRDLGDGGAERLGLQMTWSDIDIMDNQVQLGTVVFDPSQQAALDEEYGVGVVRVEPALRVV